MNMDLVMNIPQDARSHYSLHMWDHIRRMAEPWNLGPVTVWMVENFESLMINVKCEALTEVFEMDAFSLRFIVDTSDPDYIALEVSRRAVEFFMSLYIEPEPYHTLGEN